MFSLTKTGMNFLPLCTPMVKPTISGVIVERRDQVRTACFWREAPIAAIFFSRWSSTKGPFLTERAMATYLFSFGQRICRRDGFFWFYIPWWACPKASSGDCLLIALLRRRVGDRLDSWQCRASSAEIRASDFCQLCPRKHFLGRHCRPDRWLRDSPPGHNAARPR